MANRNTMHRSHLEEFERFLLSCGYEPCKPRGDYEVLRMYNPDGNGVLLVWRTEKSKEHLTITDQSERMFREWQGYKNGAMYRGGTVEYFNPAHAPVVKNL